MLQVKQDMIIHVKEKEQQCGTDFEVASFFALVFHQSVITLVC